MAYKEVSRVEITEVIRQWQTGRGIREITRSTGLARNTIRKYILTAQSTLKRFPTLLTLEDFVVRHGVTWGFSEGTIEVAKARIEYFDLITGAARYM